MSTTPQPSFELRVLQGEQRGACTAVPAGTAIYIGSGLDSDVVLRGLGDAGPRSGGAGAGEGAATEGGMRLSVKAAPDGVHLVVQQGQVQVDGRTVGAGQSVVLPMGTPLTLGATQIALVQTELPAPQRSASARAGVNAENQTEGAATAGAGQADGGAGATAAASVQAAAAAAANAPRDRFVRWPRRLLTGGGALAAVSVGVLAFAYNAVPTPPTAAQQAQRAETLLHGAGMPRLSVRADAQGLLQVSGYLETAAQRARAEQLMVADNLPRAPAAAQLQWQVWVNESVAAAVQDVFRAKGIQARAETVGPGAVRVQTSVADPLLLDEVRSTARRDVPGLAALDVQNTVPSAQGRPVVVDDPGKRVASIVQGDPPYIVTVDGTRYFEGALLPSGHRIAGIAEKQVLLEFNGVRTPLIF
jgi:type III secretion protein D